MKYFISLFFCIQLGFSQNQAVDIWNGAVPNMLKSNEKENYESTGIVKIKNVQRPILSIFLPAKNNAIGKGVLILPGGGYGMLAYDWEGTDVAKWLNSIGIAAFVLKYRLPKSKSIKVKHEAPIQDAQQAMRIIRKYATQYNIATDQIGVMGFSAGGHLASTLSTHFTPANKDEVRPNFSVLVYPVITMKKDYTHEGSRYNLLGENPSLDLVNQFSNELQVSKHTPPTFIIHATDDQVVPVENSLQYYDALKRWNVKSELHIYEKGGHGFSLAVKDNYLSTWKILFEKWLTNLKTVN